MQGKYLHPFRRMKENTMSNKKKEKFNFYVTSFQDKYKVHDVKGTIFHLKERYSDVKYISKGSYGTVCSAYDKVTTSNVIIKKIAGVLKVTEDGKKALAEVLYLNHLKGYSNIVKLERIELYPPSLSKFTDMYIFMEEWPSDLETVITNGVPLTSDHLRYLLYQLLRAADFMHSAGIIHRDLKPANILVDQLCALAVCDFGLARAFDREVLEPKIGSPLIDPKMSSYVVTRWYRAPELLAANKSYGYGIDVWSVGCILGELFTQSPIFPGKCREHQLQMIIETLSPADDELDFIENKKLVAWIKSLEKQSRVALKDVLKGAGDDLIDLLQKSLTFDPRKRITLAQMFEHEYFKGLSGLVKKGHNKCDKWFDVSFEKRIQTKKDLQNWFWWQYLRLLEQKSEFTEENRNPNQRRT